jgi:hypothetical protein
MSKWIEIFCASMYAQIMAPHNISGFSDYFLYYYIFFVLNGTKEAQLHVIH